MLLRHRRHRCRSTIRESPSPPGPRTPPTKSRARSGESAGSRRVDTTRSSRRTAKGLSFVSRVGRAAPPGRSAHAPTRRSEVRSDRPRRSREACGHRGRGRQRFPIAREHPRAAAWRPRRLCRPRVSTHRRRAAPPRARAPLFAYIFLFAISRCQHSNLLAITSTCCDWGTPDRPSNTQGRCACSKVNG